MSFTNKTAKTTEEDLVKRADEVFDNVYPTRISNISYISVIERQEALKEFKDRDILNTNLESAYKEIKKIIEGCILSDYIDTIYNNLSEKITEDFDKSKCISQLLNSVNIYLVSSKMCGDKTIDGREIPSDTVKSIVLSKKELHDNIANEKFEEANERGKLNNAVRLGCYIRDTKRYFAGEGFIQAQASSIHSFEDVSEHCSIFLWVDHIYNISKKNDNPSFEALFTFVLLHELMHLMMDVFDETEFGINGAGNLKDLGQLYGYFREESLANALALYLCDATRNDALVYSILDYFVEGQTTPYQTGLLYIEKDLLKKAVTNWMKCKKGKYLTKQLAKEWLLEVTTESPRQSELIRIEDAIATLVP